MKTFFTKFFAAIGMVSTGLMAWMIYLAQRNKD